MDDFETDPSAGEAGVRVLFESTLAMLHAARDELIARLAQAQKSKDVSLDEILKSHKLVTTALDAAVKTEQRVHDWTDANDGNQGHDGIDLDAARNDIGCRLDRLRACCRSD